MVFYFKRWILLISCLLLQACAQVDDYFLGKDNTPKPGVLPAIESSRVHLRERWSISVGKSSSASYLKLVPVIEGDTLYVAEPHGNVMAVNKKTGHVIWTKQIKQGLVSGPVVRQGVLALGTRSSGLVLLDQADGHERWHATVSGDVLSSPLLTDELLIAKTLDGHVVAFDLHTAKKRWDVDHGTPSLILKVSSSPVKMDNQVLVGFSDGKLDAIDIDSGRVVWQRSVAYATGASDVERLVDIDADPILRGDIVYLASYQGYVGAMRLSNGSYLWTKPASTYHNLSLDDHALYMTDSSDSLWAIDRNNGQVIWKQVALAARGLTAPVAMGHYVVLGDKTGLLHVVNTQQGDLMGRIQLKGAIHVSPMVTGSRVYVMTDDGRLTCLSVGE